MKTAAKRRRAADGSPERPLTIAILAMGGQGGGVLAGWIVATAERHGWYAQSTSVPGVAQRTGATLYYIEMLPPRDGKAPVLALMPTPGDVDVVIAAELMEAGRAILRGLVTPDRTTLIASTHRSLAIAEKAQPGEGLADPRRLAEAADRAARRIVAFDMERLADEAGTVISAPLLGALAASGVLPFPREAFEAAIAASGTKAAPSLAAFAAAFARAGVNELPDLAKGTARRFTPLPETVEHPELAVLLQRIRALPETLQPIIFAGTRRLADYQDAAYAGQYLDRLENLYRQDEAAGGSQKGLAFTAAAAKYLAVAMAYDDVIAVAGAKTRTERFARIRAEQRAETGQPLLVTEYMHPRAGELVGLLPAALGRRTAASPRLMRAIDLLFGHGRRIESTSVSGFLRLYLLAGLRPWRRHLYRHDVEMRHIEAWLARAETLLPRNYGLAQGVLKARRLVKGYADTHARGLSKFDRVLSAVPLLESRADAGDWMARLVTAALKDEDGRLLDEAVKTVASLEPG